MAPARDCRQRFANADHVRRRWRTPAGRIRNSLALRLRKIKTGAGRERGFRTISARRFRRGARRDVSDSPFRNRNRRCGMALAGAADEISRIELGQTGQWDLGSARRPETFHAF